MRERTFRIFRVVVIFCLIAAVALNALVVLAVLQTDSEEAYISTLNEYPVPAVPEETPIPVSGVMLQLMPELTTAQQAVIDAALAAPQFVAYVPETILYVPPIAAEPEPPELTGAVLGSFHSCEEVFLNEPETPDEIGAVLSSYHSREEPFPIESEPPEEIEAVMIISYAFEEALSIEPEETDPQPTEPPEPPMQQPVATFNSVINPLTGLPVPEILAWNRPLAISLGNAPAQATLPMNGIASADIIYEVPIEGSVTRMVGIFTDTSNLPAIGSIRSARYYIVDIAESHDAILVSAGQSFLARDHIAARGIDWVNAIGGGAAMFVRDPNRIPGRAVQNYHSLVTSGSLISSRLPAFGLRMSHNINYSSGLNFVDNATPAGGAATNIMVRFSSFKSSNFTFDAARGVYHMQQGFGDISVDFVDANDNSRVGFTNLLLLYTQVEASSRDTAPPAEANRLRTVDTLTAHGSVGRGYFVNGGRYIPIFWSRASHSSPFVYTLQNGAPLNLGRGSTYVAFIPTNTNVGGVTIW